MALTAQQTFPEFLREIPSKIIDGFLTIKTAIVEPFGETDPGEGTMGGLNAFLKTHGLIPENGEGGAFGYGILTENTNTGDGSLIVATTHAGVLDSETQNDDASNPIWHNHMVMLGTVADCGDDPGVVGISWEQPGDVTIEGSTARLTDIPNEFEAHSSFNPTSTTLDTFNPGNVVQQVVSFKLAPVPPEGGSAPDGTLKAVCVTDITPAENLIIK
ncbi:MAG TPA: hypothetical protein VE130_11440 [Nitrososphaeraceae archaeon]|nr:hypothetical protein [Nitrososphaeraceae archaeon]